MKTRLQGIFVLALLLLYSAAGAQDGRTSLTTDWRWQFADDPQFALPDYSDAGWERTELPSFADEETSGGSRYLWLRGRFTVPQDLSGRKLHILAGKLEGSIEFYVNGVLLYSHGTFPPEYFYHDSTPKQFIISPEILNTDGNNLISVRIFKESGIFSLLPIYLGDQREYLFDAHILGMLNNQVNVIFAAICLFIGLFFLMQYVGDSRKRWALYYALANLGFFIYFLELGYEYRILPLVPGQKVAKAMLLPSVAYLSAFFLEFFGSRKKRFLVPLLVCGSCLLSLLYFIIPRNSVEISTLFTVLLLPVVVQIVLMSAVSVRALRARHPDAPPIIVGMVLAVALSLHDVYFQVFGPIPMVWLQAAGIFCLNFAMFVSLSIRSIRQERELKRYTVEVEEKTLRLESFIRNIGEISAENTAISGELDRNIGLISELMARLAGQSRSISESVEDQVSVVGGTSQTVKGQLSSVEEIFGRLEVQARHVEEISATLEEMLAGIQGITLNLQGTAEFTQSLGRITGEGEKAVETSNDTMRNIEALSGTIYQIIEAVDDLAERTNLLSINAAIEAANAGTAGRGFAVVAGEIKRLAAESGQRVRKAGEHVAAISGSIGRGVEMNAEVRNLLKDINSRTISAIDRIQSVYTAVQEQREASENITRSILTLKETSGEIRQETALQQEGGRSIRLRLDDLSGASERVRSSILEISRENEGLEKLVQSIGSLSTRSRETVLRLERLLKEEAG